MVYIIKSQEGIMFLARDNEIKELENKYRTGNFEFAIIYGRRRIGKTRLIEEFAKGKECIFFAAMKDSNRNESLIQLSKCISGSDEENFPVFQSFQSAFHRIAEMANIEINTTNSPKDSPCL